MGLFLAVSGMKTVDLRVNAGGVAGK